jgi:hypothetical protein
MEVITRELTFILDTVIHLAFMFVRNKLIADLTAKAAPLRMTPIAINLGKDAGLISPDLKLEESIWCIERGIKMRYRIKPNIQETHPIRKSLFVSKHTSFLKTYFLCVSLGGNRSLSSTSPPKFYKA